MDGISISTAAITAIGGVISGGGVVAYFAKRRGADQCAKCDAHNALSESVAVMRVELANTRERLSEIKSALQNIQSLLIRHGAERE